MDSFFLLIVAVLALGVWLFVVRPRRKRERQQDIERWAELTIRVYQLESTLQELRASIAIRDAPASSQPIHTDDVAVAPVLTAPSDVRGLAKGAARVEPLGSRETDAPQPIQQVAMREVEFEAPSAPPRSVPPGAPVPSFA